MGGGKALVNAYYRSAENLGIDILYDSPVDDLELKTVNSSQQKWVTNVTRVTQSYWVVEASNLTVNGCVKPGVKTSVANGLPTTF